MKRLSSWALPIILGVSGVALIIVGTLDLDAEPVATLPPIQTATPTEVAEATPTPRRSASESASPSLPQTPSPSPTPLADDVVAVQIQVPSVGINIAVEQSTSPATDSFPPSNAAFILSGGKQPGRNTNSFIFAHAVPQLFKPLWNVEPGAEILIRMSDETVLSYVVNEVRPNVACPDDSADPGLNPEAFGITPPLALQIHDDCSQGAFWTQPTDYERLTLQTSQGYNRNWGELVIVADPVRGS